MFYCPPYRFHHGNHPRPLTAQNIFKLYLFEPHKTFSIHGDKNPVGKRQVEEFFSELNLGDIRLLELCIKGSILVLENGVERVTWTSRLIVEASRSYFAIAPFTFDKLKDLIGEKNLIFILNEEGKSSMS